MAAPFGRSVEFYNDGGPLIVLPRAALPDWVGQTEDLLADGDLAGDYARACEVEDEVDVVDVGRSVGVVVGNWDHVGTAQWFAPSEEELLFLVACVYGTDAMMESVILKLRDGLNTWKPLSGQGISGCELVLFHPACSGEELCWKPRDGEVIGIGDAVPAPRSITHATAEWATLTGEIDTDDEWMAYVVRWRSVGPSGDGAGV